MLIPLPTSGRLPGANPPARPGGASGELGPLGPWGRDRPKPRAQGQVPTVPFPGLPPLRLAPPFLGLLGGGVPSPGRACRPVLGSEEESTDKLCWRPPHAPAFGLCLRFTRNLGGSPGAGALLRLSPTAPARAQGPPAARGSPHGFAGVESLLSHVVGISTNPVPVSWRAKATVTVFVFPQRPHTHLEECGK